MSCKVISVVVQFVWHIKEIWTNLQKRKKMSSYNKQWEAKKMWVEPVSGDSTKAFCTLRRREFSIGHEGENDLTQHASTEIHNMATLAKGASNIGAFFVTSTAEYDQIAASEASYMCTTRLNTDSDTTAPTALLRSTSSTVLCFTTQML